MWPEGGAVPRAAAGRGSGQRAHDGVMALQSITLQRVSCVLIS